MYSVGEGNGRREGTAPYFGKIIKSVLCFWR